MSADEKEMFDDKQFTDQLNDEQSSSRKRRAENDDINEPKVKVRLSFGIDAILSEDFGVQARRELESGYASFLTGSTDTSSSVLLSITNNTANEISPSDAEPKKSSKKKKKKRTQFTDYQRYWLKYFYRQCEYPDQSQMEYMADSIGLSTHNVKVWYQNRRSRRKKGDHTDESDDQKNQMMLHPFIPSLSFNPFMFPCDQSTPVKPWQPWLHRRDQHRRQ